MEKNQKQSWKLPDIIDFEYFLSASEKENETGSYPHDPSDREIYLTHIECGLSDTPDDLSRRKKILRHWLDIRRKLKKNSSTGDILPGEGFQQAFTLLLLLLTGAGFMSGAALSGSLLIYNGNQPVNVSLFIGLIVILQIVLLSLLFIIRISSRFIRFSLIHRMLSPLFLRLMIKTKTQGRRILSGETTGNLNEIAGLINGKRRIYGSLFFWPFFLLTQAFGLAFNTGVFITTWLRVLGTDLAFGWQSTLPISSKAVFKLVSLLSTPWGGIVPESMAHPSLSQIEGSRLILKDGIRHLATGDMVSWWPFLLLCVFFYGILPRFILFVTAIVARNKALQSITFNTFECDKLLLRMTTPRIDEKITASETEKRDHTTLSVPCHKADKRLARGCPLIAILPSELVPAIDQEALDQRIFALTGQKPVAVIPSELNFSSDRSAFPKNHTGSDPLVFILQEAWQPPIRETLAYFKEVRLFIGAESPMIIYLVGTPAPGNLFTAVDERHFEIWKHVVKGLGDPYTHIERIRP